MEILIKHSFCAIIVALLIMYEVKSSEDPNQNAKESFDQNIQSEMHNPLAALILAENGRSASELKHNSRVKRQFGIGYADGYYGRARYYPYPLPIFLGGGGFFGPGFGRGYGFGGRGYGFGGRGNGFGGRGYGFGGRGFGGIGGRGFGRG